MKAKYIKNISFTEDEHTTALGKFTIWCEDNPDTNIISIAEHYKSEPIYEVTLSIYIDKRTYHTG